MSKTTNGTTRWNSLEQWSPRLFIVGGVLFLAGAANDGMIYFAEMANPEALSVVFLMSGFLAAVVGLVGLYPQLVDRTPRLAQASLGSVVLGVVGMLVLAVVAVVSIVLPSVNLFESSIVPLVALPTGLLLVAAFLLSGSAILKTGVFPRSVGVLLLAEVVLMIFVIVGPTESLDRGVFLVGAKLLHFIILVSIGYLLRSRSAPLRREEPSPA